MRILFARLFKSYIDNAVSYELEKMGTGCILHTYYTPEDNYRDDDLLSSLTSDIEEEAPDAVFTVNFWPLVARACHSTGTKYISWSYDCPQNLTRTEDMDYEENHIFLFDRWETEDYRRRGLSHVYHMPLAVSCDLWKKKAKPSREHACDVSLVGSLYESTFQTLLSAMDPYDQGLLRGIADSQRHIYGYYPAEELLTDGLLDKYDQILRSDPKEDRDILRRRLSYSLGTHITFQDRLTLVSILSRSYDVALYTGSVSEGLSSLISDCHVHGWADYDSEMPLIFKNSRVNLNPVLRVIRTGIPLRALDIMGCGGFLLSAYQSELAEHFEPGREAVMYGSMEEALSLCNYYLTHDGERMEIAAAGYHRVKKDFTYRDRFSRMFEIARL